MREKLFGINIDVITFDEAIEKAHELIHSDKAAQVVTINPEMIEESETNRELRAAIKFAELVIPDGVGVEWALKLSGINAERIPGIDFAKKLLEEAARMNYKVAIVGAKEEVVHSAVDNLKSEIPRLNIAYWHNGYFKSEDEIYDNIKSWHPDIVLVAMGSPKQELFIYKAKDILDRGLMIGIGGSLDVWSGNVKRAPMIFQKTGTEWLYRTITQPERFKRVFPALPLFVLKAIAYKFFK